MTEQLDVLIVGAGLSGIGAAHHLKDAFPDRSFAVLEARDALGGTWDLFRYPGVRSDSDMYTLGYRLRPWTATEAIADGASVLRYIRDTARETGIDRHIRYGHKVIGATWSSQSASWNVTAERDGEVVEFTCSFLFVCSGYYRYDQGYTPDFPAVEDFEGSVVHPQEWPADLDCSGKNVVVIGSGATAITLVPALAKTAGYVTMLQRSPTYVIPGPSVDRIGERLKKMFGVHAGYGLIRWKNVLFGTALYGFTRKWPRAARKLIRNINVKALPPGFDVDQHFNPAYDPWDQRLCLAPEGDFFAAIRTGRATVVTDAIETFTEAGLKLRSGRTLDADVVVTATGLNLLALGGMELNVDGRKIALGEQLAYRGSMLEGVPNFAFTVGYTNASWTLKADLVAEYVCRILDHMDRHGYDSCVPVNDDADLQRGPLLDFQAGYVLRSLTAFPQAGDKQPWRLGMNYFQDLVTLRHKKVDDGALRFSRPAPGRRASDRQVRSDQGADRGHERVPGAN
jgi:monooxygenase